MAEPSGEDGQAKDENGNPLKCEDADPKSRFRHVPWCGITQRWNVESLGTSNALLESQQCSRNQHHKRRLEYRLPPNWCSSKARVRLAFDTFLDWFSDGITIPVGSFVMSCLFLLLICNSLGVYFVFGYYGLVESAGSHGLEEEHEKDDWDRDKGKDDEEAGADEADFAVDVERVWVGCEEGLDDSCNQHDEDWDDQPAPNGDEDFDGDRVLWMKLSEKSTTHLKVDEEQ